jgi:RNA polymerase sigma factor (sigma-70 family)
VGIARTYDLATLVRASVDGDEEAWNELVGRYARLLAAVIRHYRLSAADAQDVSQLVWLHLVEHLQHIREPAALPGWLVTTTRHECLRYLRTKSRSLSMDPIAMTELSTIDGEDAEESLVAAERHQVLLDGLAELPPQQRHLLTLLAADPPRPYAEISRILGIPIGSIGPTRSRTLEKLRETTAVKTYLRANSEAARTGGARHALAELE